jgi:hypothetical protein
MEEEFWNLSFHGTMSMSTLIVPWKERGCPVRLLYRNRRRKDSHLIPYLQMSALRAC